MANRFPGNTFTSRQAVDPSLRKVARFLPRGYALNRGLKLQRAIMNLFSSTGRLRDVPEATVNEHVTVRLHRPVSLPDRAPALLWVHGGGTIMGHAAQDDKYLRRLSHRTGVAIAAVEHRLAPEHPYPIPIEDCYAALLWLARQPWVDPDRIAVGGASAGGHFAAALAQRAHDRNDVKLAFQLLVYPMLDDRTGTKRGGQRRIMWTETDNQLAWRWYLNGADPEQAAPARRDDLSGLPPAWIGVGTLDLFYEECLEYARRLREAGVRVHEEIAPGAFHAFDQIVDRAPVSVKFFTSQCEHLRGALVAPALSRGRRPLRWIIAVIPVRQPRSRPFCDEHRTRPSPSSGRGRERRRPRAERPRGPNPEPFDCKVCRTCNYRCYVQPDGSARAASAPDER